MNTPPTIELPGTMTYGEFCAKTKAYTELFGPWVLYVSGVWEYDDFQTAPAVWYEVISLHKDAIGLYIGIEAEDSGKYLLFARDGQDVRYKLSPREVK